MQMYWILQLTGWTTYVAVAVGITSMVEEMPLRDALQFGLFIPYGIGVTHGLRSALRSAGESFPAKAGAFVIASVVLTALVIGTDLLLNRQPEMWFGFAIMMIAVSSTVLVGTWTGLYLWISGIRRRAEWETRGKIALRDARLQALEAQMNPHFLFNCMNSIRALVIEDPPRAQDMVTRLSNVLRHSLRQSEEHTVPLVTEVEAVTDYLALEKVRFEDRLRVEVSVDQQAEQVQVPPMLLQTLVENAVKHGIAQVTEAGSLSVRATRHSGSLRLEVINSGRLQQPAPGTQMGLANIRERLRLLYGDRASLDLRDGSGSVTATVILPA
jgi:LytS/YehU family sensor histidine kinase